jgi:hypothetical protein
MLCTQSYENEWYFQNEQEFLWAIL